MLRKEEARNRRSQAWPVVISTQRVPMTRGASLRSRVKGNFQARFWSSGGRGDSPTDCRKLSDSVSDNCIGIGVVASCGAVLLIMQWPYERNSNVTWGKRITSKTTKG